MSVQIINYLTKIVNIYTKWYLNVRVILMDMEIENVEGDLKLVQINTTSARENVGKFDRGIIVFK